MSPTPPRVTRNRIDWAGLGWLFLFFWFFSGITQLLLLTSGNSGFSGFRNAMVLSTIWLAPVLLFPRWTKPLAAVIGLVLWAASLVGLSYFGIYHQEFSQSVIFVMFESNTAEASEYFSQYFNPWMTLGLVLYSLVAILLWRRLRPVYLPRFSALPVAVLLIVATIGYPFYKQLVSQGRPFDEALDKVQAAQAHEPLRLSTRNDPAVGRNEGREPEPHGIQQRGGVAAIHHRGAAAGADVR